MFYILPLSPMFPTFSFHFVPRWFVFPCLESVSLEPACSVCKAQLSPCLHLRAFLEYPGYPDISFYLEVFFMEKNWWNFWIALGWSHSPLEIWEDSDVYREWVFHEHLNSPKIPLDGAHPHTTWGFLHISFQLNHFPSLNFMPCVAQM